MKKNKWWLPVLSGVLCWLAWPPTQLAPLLWLALVPMFLFADEAMRSRKPGRTLWAGAALGFAVWNSLSLYWIYHVASEVGPLVGLAVVLVPIFFGTMLMSLPFFLYQKSRRYIGQPAALIAFCAYWIGTEHLHHEWDFAFPWLSLGNGFANFPSLIQWYEYTGVFGGSLWVLLVNILAYLAFRDLLAMRGSRGGAGRWYRRRCLPFALLVLLPVLLSLFIYLRYEEKGSPVNVVVVQPNFDPYGEKYDGVSEAKQLQRLIDLSDSLGKPNTEYFIWPETAIGTERPLIENNLYDQQSIVAVQRFLEKYRNGNVITGASSMRLYDRPESITARKLPGSERYYDFYNSALQIESSSGRVQLYHKNKLVPGVEQFPYQRYLGFLGSMMMDMGGTSGTLGHEDEQTIFYSQQGIGVVPSICYESVYGGFMASFVAQGAQLIAIVTNDGWWKNTAGYKQHAAYARLRAIETRRSVARSANTGISMLINQRGDVLQKTAWWEPTAIRGELMLNAESTFYMRHGDFLARIATGVALLSFLGVLLCALLKRFRKQRNTGSLS